MVQNNKNSILSRALEHPIILLAGVIATGIGLWQAVYEPIQKRSFFDSTFERLLDKQGAEYRSSSNIINNVIPSKIVQTRESKHWENVELLWNKHIGNIEKFYDPIASGLLEDTMCPGSKKERVCKDVQGLITSHYRIKAKLHLIEGLNLSKDEVPTLLTGLGSSVSSPSTSNLGIILDQACGIVTEDVIEQAIQSSIPTKSERISSLKSKIEQLEAYKSFDFTSAIESKKEEFISIYAQRFIDRGKDVAGARFFGKEELEKHMASIGRSHVNFMIPGLNEVFDEIKRLLSLSEANFDEEILELRAKIQKLESQ